MFGTQERMFLSRLLPVYLVFELNWAVNVHARSGEVAISSEFKRIHIEFPDIVGGGVWFDACYS